MPVLESLEQRALFRLTRFLAFVVILCLAIGLVAGVINYAALFSPNQASHVSYTQIASVLKPSQSDDSHSLTTDPATPDLADMEIPDALKPYFFESSNRRVLFEHMTGLDSDERQDYMDNLAEVVTQAKASNADMYSVINQYLREKSTQIELAKADSVARREQQAYVVVGFISILFMIALASLILVLLAIERNTRPRESFAG